MKVIVVYENIPESTNIYILDDVTPSEMEMLKQCHSVYVNASDLTPEQEEATGWLMTFLENRQTSNESPILLRGEGFDYLIVTGFLM